MGDDRIMPEFNLRNYFLLQGTVGAQGTGQTFTSTSEVSGDVALTDDNWAEQGLGVSRDIPATFNATVGLNAPFYLFEDPKGHKGGLMASAGVSLSWTSGYSLYSDAIGATLDPDDSLEARAQYRLTGNQPHSIGPAFAAGYFHETTTDVSKQKKAVDDAKKAVDDAKKAVKTAEAAVVEAKKGLAAPQAIVDEKQAAVTVLWTQIGFLSDTDRSGTVTPGEGLKGRVETLTKEIAAEAARIAELPDNNSAQKTAVAAANAALALKTEALKAVEKELAAAEASLSVAQAALVGPERVLQVARDVVTAAEAEVTKAKAKLKGDETKVAGAKATLTAAKAAQEKAEKAYNGDPDATDPAVKKGAKTPDNAQAVRDAKDAVKAAKEALNEALGLENVLKEAEKALAAVEDGNDTFTLSRASFRWAPEWGTTEFTLASEEGLNVQRGKPASSIDPMSMARHSLDFEFAFNLPTLPFDFLLQAGLVHYAASPSTAVVQIQDSLSKDVLTGGSNTTWHLAGGLEF